jgi:dihydroorotate dehydrogenase electron transfer subunit
MDKVGIDSVPVIRNLEVMPNVFLMELSCPQIALSSKPGQFVMVYCGGETLLRRPFALHRVNRETGTISLLYAVVGRGTIQLTRYKINENVNILGPLGNGFYIKPGTSKVLLAAGGMGVAPLFYLAEEAQISGLEVNFLMGARTATSLAVTEGLSCDPVCATEDGSLGWHGVVTDCLPRFIGGVDQVFACGPMQMYQSLYNMAEIKGRDVQVSLEVRMGCGIGICYGCTINTRGGLKHVCKHGPVFAFDDIFWGDISSIL